MLCYAVVKQSTGIFDMADINNSSSNKLYLKIMIMNVGGKNEGDKPTDRRKQAIYDVVTKQNAALNLLQEFKWKDIRNRAWNGISWSKHFQLTGHAEASILFDENKVTVEEYSQTLLDDTLRDLIRKGDIQQQFTPFSRMCLRKVTTKGVQVYAFICISWHGRHNGAKLEDLKEEFKSMLKYSLKLSENLSLPVLLAGDFNLKNKDVGAKEVQPTTPLIMCIYEPTDRRTRADIIDFFIASKSLVMSDSKALTLKSETDVMGVLSLFDHDPVVSSMSIRTENEE